MVSGPVADTVWMAVEVVIVQYLSFVGVELVGYASSNVRKGKTINVFEFDSVTVKLDGQRGGSGIHATITWDNLSHDESVGVDLPKGSVDSKAKEGQVEATCELQVAFLSNATAEPSSDSIASELPAAVLLEVARLVLAH